MAPGERRGAVGEAGDAASVGFVAVVADAAVQTTVDGERGSLKHPKHNIIRLLDVRKATGTCDLLKKRMHDHLHLLRMQIA